MDIRLKFAESFLVGQSPEIRDYLKHQFEDTFRVSLRGAAPEVTIRALSVGSLIVEFTAFFSGVSFIEFIKNYKEVRTGALQIASDVATVARSIRSYFEHTTKLDEERRRQREVRLQQIVEARRKLEEEREQAKNHKRRDHKEIDNR